MRRGENTPLGLALATALAAWGCVEQTGPVLTGIPTPDSVGPLPSAEHLAWQTQELSAFFHFGINTFSGKEQGDGTDSPTIFNPTNLAPGQWMKTLQGAGFRQAMLTAKHHDGFALWPTGCTDYSVVASPWKAGQGDVVREFVEAARQATLRVGLALSPFDRHEPTAGTAAYQAVFECQLKELLTKYGAIDEVWLWTSPPPAPPFPFDWKAVELLVHELQPHALLNIGNLASVAGAAIRSIGGQVDPVAIVDQTSIRAIANGTAPAPVWYPVEAVHSIRPSWFWHAADDVRVKTPDQLVDIYYNSVGRNSVLLLGLQPNTQGLLPAPDVAAMNQYGAAISAIYQTNVAAARPASADSVFRDAPGRAASMAVDGKLDTFWAAGEGKTSARIEVTLGEPTSFNVVSLQEPIALGERTTQHHVEALVNGAWTTLASGTAIGQRKLHRVGAVTASSIALVITQARGVPAIAELGVYQSPSP